MDGGKPTGATGDQEKERRELTRRDFTRLGAVAGGLAWTAPKITTVRFAQKIVGSHVTSTTTTTQPTETSTSTTTTTGTTSTTTSTSTTSTTLGPTGSTESTSTTQGPPGQHHRADDEHRTARHRSRQHRQQHHHVLADHDLECADPDHHGAAKRPAPAACSRRPATSEHSPSPAPTPSTSRSSARPRWSRGACCTRSAGAREEDTDLDLDDTAPPV